jgi:hypothetical protein
MIKKLLYTFFLVFIIPKVLLAQKQVNFSVPPHSSVKHVNFELIAPEGVSYLYPSINPNILTIHTRLKKDELSPKFSSSCGKGIENINFQIQNKASKTQDMGEDKIVISLMDIGKKKQIKVNTKEQDHCNIYLNKKYPYSLNLNYAHGESYIDLSDLSTKLLTINAGNAHVKIDYKKKNQMQMSLFSVKVGAGSVSINNMNLARANFFSADIVYGNLDLNFSAPTQTNSKYEIKVGAGTLKVKIPQEETPISIKMNISTFSTIKIPHGFTQQGEDMFVNQAFLQNATQKTTMNFIIDVSVGKAVFYY